MDRKSYMDIQRMSAKNFAGFRKGDHIVVQEKIDGANFSIAYDCERDTVAAFSRNKELSSSETLRGAYGWSQNLDKDLVRDVLGNNLVLFGEWLVSHTVVYPQERYGNAYFYDVWDKQSNEYLCQDDVKEIVSRLSLTYVPVFYEGEFIDWGHICSFVGKTDLGGEYGEGVVVKNMTTLNNECGDNKFYLKVVGEKFMERKPVKKNVSVEDISKREEAASLVESVVTRARVEKILHKMVDEGIIDQDWDQRDMQVIAKNLCKRVYEDCVKEECDIVNSIGDAFGRLVSKYSMKIARDILQERYSVI